MQNPWRYNNLGLESIYLGVLSLKMGSLIFPGCYRLAEGCAGSLKFWSGGGASLMRAVTERREPTYKMGNVEDRAS